MTTTEVVDSICQNKSHHVIWNAFGLFLYRCSIAPCLLHKLHRHGRRNRNALVTTDDHGIDADNFPLYIYQRSTGVTGRQRDIGTEDGQFFPASILRRDQRADDAARNRIALTPGM